MEPDPVLELVRARGRAEGVAWLEAAIAGVVDGTRDLRVIFPAVGRQVGRDGLETSTWIRSSTGDRVTLAAWRIDDAARVALLRAAGRREPAGALKLASELYFGGDARERVGALRALSFLPGAATDAAAVPAVLDAMRVSQGEIFEAAILDNPYASANLPQHEWRKAVLKAVFNGHAIDRIVRIDARADAELGQSLLDFATEREAATRVVPPDIWRVAALHPPPGLAAKLLGYLEHPSVEQRRGAAAGLEYLVASDARLRPFLVERAGREHDGAVRATLARAIDPS